jgi:hypothetical protein
LLLLLLLSAFRSMRGRIGPLTAAIAVFIFVVFFFTTTPTSWTQEQREEILDDIPYAGRPDPLPWNPPRPKTATSWTTAEQLVIKVKIQDEDTAWVSQLEPAWQIEIITIDPMYTHIHPSAHRPDKGRITEAYLTWIIENYNNLPETLVFIPPADPWGRDKMDFPNALKHLKVAFVQKSGFVNIRCPSRRGPIRCDNKVLNPHNPSHEFRTLEANIPEIYRHLFSNTTDVPKDIATVLGAEFAVSKAQVQKRSVDDYLRYWTWLNKTKMDDDSSGLLFEYIWHIVFGKDAIFCPEPVECECDVYGKCDGAKGL